MAIHAYCPRGHKLRIKESLAGKTVRCPKCDAAVVVPEPDTRGISDSSVVALLTQHDSDQAVVTRTMAPSRAPLRRCPKCKREISAGFHICPSCSVYLPTVPEQILSMGTSCPACGTGSLPHDTHCATCGADLRAA